MSETIFSLKSDEEFSGSVDSVIIGYSYRQCVNELAVQSGGNLLCVALSKPSPPRGSQGLDKVC